MAAQELAGRVTVKSPTAILTRMRLLLATAADAPLVGAAFLGTPTYATTVAGICMSVTDINNVKYPGRPYCEATYAQPILESEIGTL